MLYKITINTIKILICAIIVYSNNIFSADLENSTKLSQYLTTVINADNYLPQNSVHSLYQDINGYMWIATQEGLVRFDGIKAKLFDRSNVKNLPSNYIKSIKQDKHSNLWIGTSAGLVKKTSKGEFELYDSENGFIDAFINTIFININGDIYLGTQYGLYVYNGKKFELLKISGKQINNPITALLIDSKNRLWFAEKGKDIRLVGLSDLKELTLPRSEIHGDILSLFEDRNGTIWIGSENSVIQYNAKNFRTYSHRDGLVGKYINCIFQDKKGNIWIGTDEGLNRICNNKWEFINENYGFPCKVVNTIYEDSEGNIWVGTNGNGVCLVKDPKFKVISQREGIWGKAVWSVFVDSKGRMLLGTSLNILNIIDKNYKIKRLSTADGLPDDWVVSICEDKQGALWFGTRSSGVYKLLNDKVVKKYTVENGLASNEIRAMAFDNLGRLWVGTYEKGINILDKGLIRTLTVKDGLSDNVIKYLYLDSKGCMWIATNNILNEYENGKLKQYDFCKGLKDKSANVIRSICQDKNSDMWIGTRGGGLIKLSSNGQSKIINAKSGLPFETIFGVHEDNCGNLWLSGNKGIIAVKISELNDYLSSKINKINFKLYDKSEGLYSCECNGGSQSSSFKDNSGNLYFGTIDGLLCINPMQISINKQPPLVHIEEMKVDGKVVYPENKVNIEAGKNKFEFYFTAISYTQPRKVQVKYKLEGFDKDWIVSNDIRKAVYTNIPPGNYTFKVIAVNNDGVWNNVGDNFSFYYRPYFYQTTIFYVFCLFVLVFILYKLYRYRRIHLLDLENKRTMERQILDRNEELEAALVTIQNTQNHLIQAEKMISIGQLTAGIAHEINNPLAFVSSNNNRFEEYFRDLLSIYEELKKSYDDNNHSDLESIKVQIQNIENKYDFHFIVDDFNQLMTNTKSGIDRIRAVVDSLKGFGSIETTGNSKCDIAELIEESLIIIATEFKYKSVVEKNYSHNSQLLCNVADIKQVLINILLNAAQSIDENGVIKICTYEIDDNLYIEIIDNGCGIPKESLNKIFDPFFTSKDVGKAKGLGLWICSNLLARHDGRINVESEIGKGSKFVIMLPIKK